MEDGPIFIAILLLCNSCRSGIADKLTVFDEERRQLSIDHMNGCYGIEKGKQTIEPKMIVLHRAAIPGLDKSFEAFRDPVLPGPRGRDCRCRKCDMLQENVLGHVGNLFENF